MKKLFLALTALVGMMTGLSLTSCGGGGGGDDLLPNLSGMSFGDSTIMQIRLDNRPAYADYYNATITTNGEDLQGSFFADSVDIINDCIVITGRMAMSGGDWLLAADWWIGSGGTEWVRVTVPGSTAKVKIEQISPNNDSVQIFVTMPVGTGYFASSGATEPTYIRDNEGNSSEDTEVTLNPVSGAGEGLRALKERIEAGK